MRGKSEVQGLGPPAGGRREALRAGRGRPRSSALPLVFLNAAMTADGKIAPGNRAFFPFGSERDQELLLELRAQADAVMAGARTVNSFPMNLGPGPKRFRELRLGRGLAEYNLRVIVSGTGSINPNAEIFRHRFSPIILLTTERISATARERLRAAGAEIKICGRREIDFSAALSWLGARWGVKGLLCEGGGELNGALLRAGLVDEIYVTLCPVIFGGRQAPTLADGKGFETLAEATRLQLKSLKRIGNELFLVYRVKKKPR